MQLTVVTPTYNEAANVPAFARAVTEVLRGVDHEILIVDDDSPDRTWEVAEGLRAEFPRVRVLRRRGERSLAASVIEGFSAARGQAVACMDADLQHDPAILPEMLRQLTAGGELVVGCRYMPGGGTSDWGLLRRLASRAATQLAESALGLRLRDPMSGYFMVRRDEFLRVRDRLSAQGFKILIEIAAQLPSPEIREVPFVFRPRVAGQSKVTATVMLNYLAQLRRLRAARSRLPAKAAAQSAG
ncbi:MAG: polyprenol monophosphomannose synthase [Terriglobales bacterium]